MVAHDLVERAVLERGPQRIAIGRGAQRWRALVLGRTVRHIVAGEHEVVRTGLGGHRDPARARGRDRTATVRARDMHDVDARTMRLRELRDALDRIHLGGGGSARGPRRMRARARGRARGGQRGGPLSVDHERGAQGGQPRQGAREVGLAHGRELVHARGHEEALEREHAGLVQPGDLGLESLTRDHATEEAHVHVALPIRGRTLAAQGRAIHGGGDAVERHVGERRHTAGGRGTRRMREALPRGAAGLVDVHVRIHEPRREHGVMRIVHGQAGGPRLEVMQRHDAAVTDLETRRAHALGGHDTAGAEDQRVHGTFRGRGQRACSQNSRTSRADTVIR